jgi:hypothetical protein
LGSLIDKVEPSLQFLGAKVVAGRLSDDGVQIVELGIDNHLEPEITDFLHGFSDFA